MFSQGFPYGENHFFFIVNLCVLINAMGVNRGDRGSCPPLIFTGGGGGGT